MKWPDPRLTTIMAGGVKTQWAIDEAVTLDWHPPVAICWPRRLTLLGSTPVKHACRGLPPAQGRQVKVMPMPLHPAPNDLSVLVLAAGRSSRMRGVDKLLEPVFGVPLLRHVVDTALTTGLPVTVALPPDRPDRAMALAGLDLSRVTVPDPQGGMAASFRAGLGALPERHAVLLLLGDMPDITPADLAQFTAAFQTAPDAIHQGCAADGTPGHPVLFPADLRPTLMQLHGDKGAKDILRAQSDRINRLVLPARHALTDLDTPEDWAAWRETRD